MRTSQHYVVVVVCFGDVYCLPYVDNIVESRDSLLQDFTECWTNVAKFCVMFTV